MVEVQDIFRRYGKTFLESHRLSPVQMKAFRSIQHCRTSTLGAHIDACDACGFEKISYNSCRNRHCPKCQSTACEQWVEKQNQYLLNTNYFHVVFTLPEELNSVMLQNQTLAYRLFFKSVSETLLELCGDKKYLGATPGITAVLHTWGQNLMYHPHIHCIVTGGGLTDEKRWRQSRKKFFLPVKVLSAKFRGKLLFYLKRAGLHFDSVLYHKPWVIYCKPPFTNPSTVINYLGRYTHRVAISNNRILALKDGEVSFRWKDYRDGCQKVMTISATEFIRRFMLHILPQAFRKIRHYGLLAARNKLERIHLCQRMTKTPMPIPLTPTELLQKICSKDFPLCPCCGIGHFTRAPPSASIA